ncbi:cation diffusion facilitator family transporter [Hymenobacter sp. BT635]|uniref:Cation diffusion facilitator family transporter n=1 Tax=Hymenobacter nitidus TaxID=2880929 RepID=A0ABS8AGY2_9BACT|nr:cation diffusion facilitator family transporter [Hymenobacter nitidus]MCB2378724.1 cation diffusion facilitator family transporter [Hymenobacter nitidus]
MAHSHDHSGHDHHHHHTPTEFGRAFGVGIALNIAFVIVEVAGGLWANSSALLSDAGHNLSDVLSLALAWGATLLAQRRSSARYTYGYKGVTIQAALLNAALLYVALGAILWETISHLRHPEPVNGKMVMLLAGLGIVINGFTAWLFSSGQKGDVNVRGAYLHMLTDALVSAGVVVGGGLVLWTGWLWLDPLISFLILALIGYSSWGLLRETLQLSLQAVPAGIDLEQVRTFLLARPGVTEVHDLHVWPLSTQDTALTAHVVRPGGSPDANQFLQKLQHDLVHEFNIGHCTVQIEQDTAVAGHHGCCDAEHLEKRVS